MDSFLELMSNPSRNHAELDMPYSFSCTSSLSESFDFRKPEFLGCSKKTLSSQPSEYQDIDLLELVDEEITFKFKHLEFLKENINFPSKNISGLEIIDPIFNLTPFKPAIVPQILLKSANYTSIPRRSFTPELESDISPQYPELEPLNFSDSIVDKINIKTITKAYCKPHIQMALGPILFQEKRNSNWDISNIIDYYDPKYISLPGIHRCLRFFSHEVSINQIEPRIVDEEEPVSKFVLNLDLRTLPLNSFDLLLTPTFCWSDTRKKRVDLHSPDFILPQVRREVLELELPLVDSKFLSADREEVVTIGNN